MTRAHQSINQNSPLIASTRPTSVKMFIFINWLIMSPLYARPVIKPHPVVRLTGLILHQAYRLWRLSYALLIQFKMASADCYRLSLG